MFRLLRLRPNQLIASSKTSKSSSIERYSSSNPSTLSIHLPSRNMSYHSNNLSNGHSTNQSTDRITDKANEQPSHQPFQYLRPFTPHFVTGSQFAPPNVMLDDAAYALALDCLVKGCNDLIVTYTPEPSSNLSTDLIGQRQILIAHRTQYPQRSWWLACGGRMKPGESIAQSSVRLLRRELGFDPSNNQSNNQSVSQFASRLVTVGHYAFGWEFREQAPQQHGTSDVSVVSAIEVTSQEKSIIDLNTDEPRRWTAISEVLADQSYHPAMRRALLDYSQLLRLDRIARLVKTGATDSEIADATRSYIEQQLNITGNDRMAVWTEENVPGRQSK